MAGEHHQVGPRRHRPGTKWLVVIGVAVAGLFVVAGLLLVSALSTPVGSQHDSDELGGDYCAYFPEDC